MLFNSYLFLFLFLPVTLTAHYLFSAISPRLAAVWLCITSLVFYGWWNPQFVMLLMGSIAFNYIVSLCILSTANRSRLQLAVTTFGVASNIALLFHYKYFVTLVNFAGELGFGSGRMDDIILPLDMVLNVELARDSEIHIHRVAVPAVPVKKAWPSAWLLRPKRTAPRPSSRY